MVTNKHTPRIIIAVTALAVILCLLATVFSSRLDKILGGKTVSMEYESKLFNTDQVIDIDIQMDEDDWNKMLESALSEEYYACDVVINGTKVYDVGIRPKGNTSLSSIAMNPDTDRYSLKLEFDHFVEGQTCFGLDKLILNNNYADATNMKEAIIYDMYQYIGANASLYNFAKVCLNGEYWGVYLALEGVEDSFMLRNFGTQDGELYKPESMGMGNNKDSSSDNQGQGGPGGMPGGMPAGGFGDMPGGGFGGNGERPERPGKDSGSDAEEGSDTKDSGFPGFPGGDFEFDPENMPEKPSRGDFNPGGGGGFSMGGNGGANLNYSDDDLDSYSTIWDGSITGTGDKDHKRVVTALKNISEGTDLEEYLDVENILKYMAVHVFSVNMDSLSGNMAHNYYLYEYDGKLNMFPWDYNLAFGGMSMGSDGTGDSVVNDAIDTPFSGTDFFDALLEDEEYLAIYHSYLDQLVEEYVNSGRFDETYNRIRSQIDSLVETDPTAFYSYEEYQDAADMLYKTVKLRAESIRGQLDGTIPSTDDGQREDSSALVDASDIDVKVMGTFNMGGDDAEDRTERRREGGKRVFADPPSFEGSGMSGQPGQTGNNTMIKNLIIYGICLAGALLVLILVRLFCRRRKNRRRRKPVSEEAA